MARINYDDQTATAYKAVREIPREGLSEWRDAMWRHLRPFPGMTLVDIGAGTGQFASAFSDWFGLSVLAIEPSRAMRDHIPRTPTIQSIEGSATALPLPDASADAAWLSRVIHHIPDLRAAAHEIRRALRAGGPVLIRVVSRADWTESKTFDGSPKPLGRSRATLPSPTRARRSQMQDSTRRLSSRSPRGT